MPAQPGPAPIDTLFLRDDQHGGSADQLGQVASALADFVTAAESSLDVCIYDFRLSDDPAATVVGALTAAADRGVAVRIGYDAGKPAAQTAEAFAAVGGDPAPLGTQQWITDHFADSAVTTKPILAAPHLMHCKYVIRDGAGEGRPAVWTGSTNFTDDAWTRQENNIIVLPGGPVAAGFLTDFDQMWTAGSIKNTGAHGAGSAPIGDGTVGWDFSPGDGPALDAGLVQRITAAQQRIVVASMVLTSHDVLAALDDALDRDVTVSGIYDGGEMDPVVRQWRRTAAGAPVLANWQSVSAHLARKNSTPYSPTGPHDFMHLKVLLADDTVVTGSYNFSANAERNAENQVHLDDPATVAAYDAYLQTVIDAYQQDT
jgi:phosphatidylserine/phosphatidylglycerophosphate/cardiolipin synthase-like enzyme